MDNPPLSPSAEPRPEHNRHLSTSSASERRHLSLDGSALKWATTKPGPVSPGSFRNPSHDADNFRPLVHRHPSFPFDENMLQRSSYDHNMFQPGGSHPMDEGQMKGLNINDRSPSVCDEFIPPKAGMKRRASSPHQDLSREDRSSVSSAPGSSDLYIRRSIQQLPSRNSSVSRYAANHGSISSVSSYGLRNGSMASSYGLSVASSATSYTSGRLSPAAPSPAIDPSLAEMQYTNAKPPTPSPSLAAPSSNYPVGIQEHTTKLAVHATVDQSSQIRQQQHGITNAQGMLRCECCPKKPKKFNNQEELK